MSTVQQVVRRPLWAIVGVAAILVAGCAGQSRTSDSATSLRLSGANQVPPVSSPASGTSTITVGPDRSVTGSVTTTGMVGTAAHIHQAAAGQNGPVAIPLTKTSENVFSVPPGTRLTDAQWDAYKAGNLYINVHSDANKGGQIRGQLRP